MVTSFCHSFASLKSPFLFCSDSPGKSNIRQLMGGQIPLAAEQVARITLLVLAHTLPYSVDAAAFCRSKEDEKERGRVWEKKAERGREREQHAVGKTRNSREARCFWWGGRKWENILRRNWMCVREEYVLKEKIFQWLRGKTRHHNLKKLDEAGQEAG